MAKLLALGRNIEQEPNGMVFMVSSVSGNSHARYIGSADMCTEHLWTFPYSLVFDSREIMIERLHNEFGARMPPSSESLDRTILCAPTPV